MNRCVCELLFHFLADESHLSSRYCWKKIKQTNKKTRQGEEIRQRKQGCIVNSDTGQIAPPKRVYQICNFRQLLPSKLSKLEILTVNSLDVE